MIQLTWRDVFLAVRKLCQRIPYETTGIYGIPTGGSVVAVLVSERAQLPLLDAPVPGCLVVDDLVDTGDTMARYAGYNRDVLFRKPHSPSDIGPQAQTLNGWIQFCWEHNSSPLDAVTRLLEFANDQELVKEWRGMREQEGDAVVRTLTAALQVIIRASVQSAAR